MTSYAQLVTDLQDTSTHWASRIEALKSLQKCLQVAPPSSSDDTVCLLLALATQLADARASIVRDACMCISAIAASQGPSFAPFAGIVLGALLDLHGALNSSSSEAAAQCVEIILTSLKGQCSTDVLETMKRFAESEKAKKDVNVRKLADKYEAMWLPRSPMAGRKVRVSLGNSASKVTRPEDPNNTSVANESVDGDEWGSPESVNRSDRSDADGAESDQTSATASPMDIAQRMEQAAEEDAEQQQFVPESDDNNDEDEEDTVVMGGQSSRFAVDPEAETPVRSMVKPTQAASAASTNDVEASGSLSPVMMAPLDALDSPLKVDTSVAVDEPVVPEAFLQQSPQHIDDSMTAGAPMEIHQEQGDVSMGHASTVELAMEEELAMQKLCESVNHISIQETNAAEEQTVVTEVETSEPEAVPYVADVIVPAESVPAAEDQPSSQPVSELEQHTQPQSIEEVADNNEGGNDAKDETVETAPAETKEPEEDEGVGQRKEEPQVVHTEDADLAQPTPQTVTDSKRYVPTLDELKTQLRKHSTPAPASDSHSFPTQTPSSSSSSSMQSSSSAALSSSASGSSSTPAPVAAAAAVDIEAIRAECFARASSESAILAAELEKVENQLSREKEEKRKMAQIIRNYEQMYEKVLDDADRANALQTANKKMGKEYAQLQEAFKELQKRYEAVKEGYENAVSNESVLKAANEKKAAELKRAEDQYGTLKKYAEEKLLEAKKIIETQKAEQENQRKINEELREKVAKLQPSADEMQRLNQENLSLKARIFDMTTAVEKAEAAEKREKEMQAQLKEKEQENEELRVICQQMLEKLESK